MALTRTNQYYDDTFHAFMPTGGTSTGVRATIPIPVRCKLLEVGFSPNSLMGGTASITMAVTQYSFVDSTTVFSTQLVSSVLGQVSSINMLEGQVFSVVPATNCYLNPGDVLDYTFSGGNAAGIGYTYYALVRKAGGA